MLTFFSWVLGIGIAILVLSGLFVVKLLLAIWPYLFIAIFVAFVVVAGLLEKRANKTKPLD